MSRFPQAFSRLAAGFVGRGVICRLAYMIGALLFDSRAHVNYDYRYRRRDREDVLDWLMLIPGGHREDLESLWNRINRRNKHPNAVVARTFIGSLVWELGFAGNRRAVMRFAEALRDRYGVAVVFAIHDARTLGQAALSDAVGGGERKTNRNIHVHLIVSYCVVRPDGSLGKKVVELDPIAAICHGLPTPMEVLRPLWQQCVNEELERAGLPARVDMLSLQEQGTSDLPTVPLGAAEAELERRGVRTPKGDLNHEIRKQNRERRVNRALLERVHDLFVRARLAPATMSLDGVSSRDFLRWCSERQSAESIDLVLEEHNAIFMQDGGAGAVVNDEIVIVEEGAASHLRELVENLTSSMRTASRASGDALDGARETAWQPRQRLLPEDDELLRRYIATHVPHLQGQKAAWLPPFGPDAEARLRAGKPEDDGQDGY